MAKRQQTWQRAARKKKAARIRLNAARRAADEAVQEAAPAAVKSKKEAASA